MIATPSANLKTTTTPGAYDTSFNSRTWDAFVTKLSPSGSTLAWSTYLGGSGSDYGNALDLDGTGAVPPGKSNIISADVL